MNLDDARLLPKCSQFALTFVHCLPNEVFFLKNDQQLINRWLGNDWASIAHRFLRISSNTVTGNARKVEFHDFWISWKVTWTQNTSKIAPGGPSCLQTDPWWSTVPPKIKLRTIENHKNEKRKPENLKMCKDARRKIIEIGLAEILSTRMACHLVTKGFPDIHG